MGLKKFEIQVLDNSVLSYFPGQTVSAVLHIHNNKDYKHEGIQVTIEGKAYVRWTERKQVTEAGRNGRKSTRKYKTVVHSSQEQYFLVNFDVVGTGSRKSVLLPGHHQFPIVFILPQGIPTSFVGKSGVVTYEIKAEVKRSWKKNLVARVPFTVNGILDLNTEPGASQQLEVRKYKRLCCLFCKSGPIGFVLHLPSKGFVSGQHLNFVAELNNQSNRNVNGVSMTLSQTVTYHAEGQSTSRSKTICQIKGPAVEKGESETWNETQFKIPPLPPSRLACCRIIDVQYTLKFEMDVAGLAINLRQEVPIIIGSVPLRVTYEDIRAAIQNNPEIQPSAPSVEVVDGGSEPTSFLQGMYPDLPPPTYSEAILQDRETFGDDAGDQNPGFVSSEGNKEFEKPSAPPAYDFQEYTPKYVTYAN